ncbi:MAG TPA: hypothetical protein VN875_07130 [Candidatus Binatus sp.]|jgi:hypothetical protein|nr:hypothetical protein [Candidatus Binatus sp.]
MKLGYRISLFAMLALTVFASTWQLDAQRPRNRAKVHSMQATSDASGAHPDKFDADGAVTITCLAAFSETPNARPEPSCRISAPGFNGILKKGETAKTTGAGAVTLTCNGPGNLRCSARVDIPAPS